MAVFDAMKEKYELVEIDQHLVLFTNMRLDRNTVPEGIYCYDVRDSDELDGSMAEIKPHVLVNHWGTILCREAFLLNEWGGYDPEDWSFLGEHMTLAEFLSAAPEQLAAYLEPQIPGAGMTMK